MGRLLWITERYPPAKGGMAVSCARQVRGLRSRGVSLDVAAFTRDGPELTTVPRDGGFDFHLRREIAQGLGPNLAWSTVREQHVGSPYACAVGFGASWAGFVAVTFGAWLNVPAVVLVRGNDLDRDWFLPRRGAWLREALSRAAAIGAVSCEKVARIARMYPGRTVMWTPNGVDVKRWQLLPADLRRRDEVRALLGAPERRIIGLFGDLKCKKGVPFWLEALRDRGLLPRASLLVVGNLDQDTTRILEDRALAPASLRLPFCGQDELPGLYAACDFIAIPSNFDGMPNVLLEAMACGAVPIVSDAGGLGDVVTEGETGFRFPAGNREAAGDATARALATDQSAWRALSQQVKHTVAERFSLEQEIGALSGLIAKAIG